MTNRRNRTHQRHQPQQQQQQQQLSHAAVNGFADVLVQPPTVDLVLPGVVQPHEEHQQPAMTANQDASMPPPVRPPAATTQPRRQPRRILSLAEKYHAPLRHLMSWRDGVTYEKNHQFSSDQLENVTAQDIYRWAKFRVYGDPDADEGVSPPIHYRVNLSLAGSVLLAIPCPATTCSGTRLPKLGIQLAPSRWLASSGI